MAQTLFTDPALGGKLALGVPNADVQYKGYNGKLADMPAHLVKDLQDRESEMVINAETDSKAPKSDPPKTDK